MLGREVDNKIREKGDDFLFFHIKDVLENADVRFGVLDAPVALHNEPNPEKPSDCPLIKSRQEALNSLERAPIDIVHIGTNHILDFGSEGLTETRQGLHQRGIKHIGAGKDIHESRQPVFIEAQGVRLGFLGYCLSYPADTDRAGCAPLKLNVIKEDIEKIRDQVDHVIV